MMGTPAFMPPEQALGERESIGPHSDCWAVGATMFALLSGEFVHKAESGGAQLAAAATRRARSIASVVPDLAAPLVAAVDKALQFEVADRWNTAREMRDALVAAIDEGESFASLASRVHAELCAELSLAIHASETVPPVREGKGANPLDTSDRDSSATEPSDAPIAPTLREKDKPHRRTENNSATVMAAGVVRTGARRQRRAWMAVLAVVLLGIGAFPLARIVRTRASIGPRAAMSAPASLPPPVAIAVVDLPISAKCTATAKNHYREGLTALQQASWEVAYADLAKGAAADPMCPEVQVQLVILGYSLSSLSEVREQFHRVLSLRDELSARDRLLINAYEALIISEPANLEEFSRRMDAAASQFPWDAQILEYAAYAHTVSRPELSDVEKTLQLARRATELDPKYADAWQTQAKAFRYLGEVDEAMRALERCIVVAPGSADCLAERIRILRPRGDCTGVVADARSRLTRVPTSYNAYSELANALASQGAPDESVEAALEQIRNFGPGNRKEMVYLYYRAMLAVLRGNFVAAEKIVASLETELTKTVLLFDHARVSALAMDLMLESGKDERAIIIARRFFDRKSAWTDGYASNNEHEPFLAGALLRHAKISTDRWSELAENWEERHRRGLTKRQLWAFRWGPVSGVREHVDEAWARRPDEIDSATLSGEQLYYPSLVKMHEGHIALAASRNTDAIALLEPASKSCDSLQMPFHSTRAHRWLGEAKERIGDTAGACDAYAVVLNRWGNAKPRSVTAEEVRRRSRALGCKGR